MQNVDMKVAGKKLTIVIDLDQELNVSGSGKNVIVGTTGGNVPVPGIEGLKIGINLYKPVALAKNKELVGVK